MRRQRLPSCTVNGLTPPEIRPHKRKKPTGIPIGNDFIMVELVAVFGHSDCASKSRVFKHSTLKFGTL